jgi:diadenosine tetraphosphate (Ap4A) HIT family hydrolase
MGILSFLSYLVEGASRAKPVGLCHLRCISRFAGTRAGHREATRRYIFDLDGEEYAACFALVREIRYLPEARHQTKDFNLGVNCGEVAGQTISHADIHLIPRYAGDVSDPRVAFGTLYSAKVKTNGQ